MDNKNLEVDSKSSILLYSLPRSGSTWIGKILDSHPSTIYRHEPDSVNQIKDVPLYPVDFEDDQLGQAFRSYHDGVLSMTAPKVCGKAPIFPKAYFGRARQCCYIAMSSLSKLAARFGIALPVVGAPTGGRDSRLVWKSIESLGRLGLALTALPHAQGILLIRHPCGYIASVIRGQSQFQFEDNTDSSQDYRIFEMLLETEYAQEQGLTLDGLRLMSPEERLAWRWALTNTKAVRDTDGVRSRCLVVLYDEVCDDPIISAMKIFSQVGLPWSRQTEDFILKSVGKHKESYYGVIKNPSIAANRWREELDPEVVAGVMEIVKRSDAGALFVE